MKRKLLIPFLVVIMMIAATLGLSACDGCGDSEGITLSSTEITIEVGGTATVSATVSTDDTVTWTSENTSIATVSALANAAIVKGVAEGETTITATAGEYTATCTVTVTAATTYTIYNNGTAITSADVVFGESLTLTASASDGSTVSYWYVEDSSIATVNNGVVTGVSFGTTTLYAGKDSSHCGSIKLNVVAAEGAEGYTIEYSTEAAALESDANTWYYWNEYCEMTANYYLDGAITLAFSNNDGNWYNLQLFYKNSTLTAGSNYKLTFKVNSTAAGSITVNGTVVELSTGDNNVSITYTESSTGSSASIQFGVDGVGTSIKEGTIVLSDFVWTEIQAETLAAPSFTVSSSGVITITDTNDADKVGGYKLYLYSASGVLAGAVDVTNGMNISELDTSAIAIGTYTAYLRAIGSSSVYTNSGNSTSSTTITVTEEPVYTLSYAKEPEAISTPGVWYYWNSTWVQISNNTYENNVVSLTFGNNAGFWYDTQLFYKATDLKAGNTYKLTFTLTSTAAGSITVNGTVVEIKEGENAIEVSYTESSSSSSISIQFGVDDGATDSNGNVVGKIDMSAATVTLTGFNWELTAEGGGSGSGETYDAADFTTLVDTLDDTTTYAISHGAEEAATTNAGTIYVWYIGDYQYWGDWAAVTNSDVTANYDNGTITWSTKNEFTAYFWYANQLFYKNSALTSGTTYMLTLTIESAAAGTITVNGTVVTLTAGTNNVTVYYTESGASLSIQLGVNDYDTTLTAPSLTISDVKWYAKDSSSSGGESGGSTEAPDLTNAVAATLTDGSVYNETYMQFTATSTYDIKSASYVTVNGTTASWTEYTPTETNTWTFKVYVGNTSLSSYTFYWYDSTGKAVAYATYPETSGGGTSGGGESGGESGTASTYTATYTNNLAVDGSSYGEDVAALDTWTIWYADYNYVTLTADYTSGNDGITFTFSNNAIWYGIQVFYKNSELITGNTYTLNCTITVDAACNVTINGKVYNLTAGENSVSIEFTLTDTGVGDGSGTSAFDMQFGVQDASSVGAATVTISNVSWYGVGTSGGTSGGESGGGTSGGESGGSTDTPDLSGAVAVSLTLVQTYGVNDSEYFYFTATSTYDIKTASYVTVNGTTASWTEYTPTETNTWAFKVYAGDTSLSSYTFYWYDSTGTIVAYATYPESSGGGSGSGGTSTATVTAVAVTGSTNTISVGGTLTLTATVTMSDGSAYTGTITWSSTSTATATVNSNGLVTGVSEGTVVITASIGSVYDIITIFVTEASGGESGGTTTYNAIYTNTLAVGDSTTEETVALDTWAVWYKASYWWAEDYDKVESLTASYTAGGDGITFTYTGSSTWYYVQVFYKSSELTTGNTYTLNCTITVDVACDVTINGKVYSLSAGSNDVSIEFTLTDTGVGDSYGTSSFDLQMGVDGVSVVGAATVTISNVSWTETTASGGESGGESGGSSDTPDLTNAVAVSLTDGSAYNDTYMQFTATSTYDLTTANYVTVNGTQYWSEPTLNGDGSYTFKVYVGDTTLSSFTFYWYDSTGTVVAYATYPESSGGGESGGGTTATVASVSVSGNNSIEEGESTNLTVTITMSDGTTSAAETVSWSSSNIAVATVDSNGVVTAKEAGITYITATSDSNSSAYGMIKITVTAAGGTVTYTAIESGGEEAASASWKYWNDQWYSGSSVTVNSAKYTENSDGTYTVIYSITSADGSNCSYGFQLFYNDQTTYTIGKTYTLTASITSDVDATITINGTAYTLTAGTAQDVSVTFTYSYDGTYSGMSLIDLQHAISGAFTANVTISNIKWTETSASAPTVESVTISGDTTVTAGETLTLTATVTMSDSSTYTGSITWDTSDSDIATVSNGVVTAVSAGTVTITATADGVSGTITITVNAAASASYTIAYAGESDAIATPDTWYYWTNSATINTRTYADDTVTLEFSNNTESWYNIQLFYENSNLITGSKYTLTLKITSTTAGSITINGTVYELEANVAKTIELIYEEDSGASISIQLGVESAGSYISEGTLTISSVSWEEIPYETSGSAIKASYANALANDGEDASKANADTWYYWHVQDENWWCDTVVTMTTATLDNETITLTYTGGDQSYSVQLFYTSSSLTSGNYYRLTCTVYASVACTVTINGKSFDLSVGENSIEVDFTLGNNDISAFDMQMAGTSTETTIKVYDVAWYNLVEKTSGGTSSDPVELTATYQSFYNGNWITVDIETTLDLTSSSGLYTLYCNGSVALGSDVFWYNQSEGIIRANVMIASTTVESAPETITLTWYDGDTAVATTTFSTVAVSG